MGKLGVQDKISAFFDYNELGSGTTRPHGFAPSGGGSNSESSESPVPSSFLSLSATSTSAAATSLGRTFSRRRDEGSYSEAVQTTLSAMASDLRTECMVVADRLIDLSRTKHLTKKTRGLLDRCQPTIFSTSLMYRAQQIADACRSAKQQCNKAYEEGVAGETASDYSSKKCIVRRTSIF
eukprot:g9036.t1